jgi:L-ribulose-5-phosphate 3-epimerase
MKFGITQYAASADGAGFIEAAARLGLSGVEPYIADVESEFLTSSPANRAAIKQLAAQNGIEIPSVCLGAFNGDACIVSSDGFEKATRVTGDALRFSADIGAKLMLLCTYVVSHPDTPQKKQNLMRLVRAVEPLARKLGVKIALETPLAADELAAIVDATHSDFVGIYYDYGNALANRFDPGREIPILGKRIFAIHAKDSITGKLGGAHLGDGDLNLDEAMRATHQIGYDGWMMLETPAGDESATRADIKALRKVALGGMR